MLSPAAIVEQVWQKIVPTDWKIIHGRRRSSFSLGISATIWTFAVLVLLALLVTGINLFFRASQAGKSTSLLDDLLTLATATLAGYPALAVVIAGAAALALLLGLIVWITNARRHAGDPDPVVVLLPHGFVEYVSQHNHIVGILYGDVVRLDFKRRTRSQSSGNQPNAQVQKARRSKVWLELFYTDGSTDRWRPRADFGPPERLYETIIKAHALYEILYGDGK
jgi:hypothetical protein